MTAKTPANNRYAVRVDARGRHGFAVIEDHTTHDNAAVFTGPDAEAEARAEMARLNTLSVSALTDKATEAHGLALAEYAERAKTPAPGDETIHFWDYSSEHSACGVDIVRTPYTYGSPECDEITCPACINLIAQREASVRP